MLFCTFVFTNSVPLHVDTSSDCLPMNKYLIILFVIFAAFAAVMACISWWQIDRYPDKVWVHRCNSIEKFDEMHERYPSVEVDLIFRSEGYFDVTHDQENSIGLRLDGYFEKLKGETGHMWLDVKNISATNCNHAISVLDSLTSMYHIDKIRLIIESPDTVALSAFHKAGYYTSWYVVSENPANLTDDEIEQYIREMRRVVDNGRVSALSFPGWWYPEISKRLDRNIDLLTWKENSSQFKFFLNLKNYKMLYDPQVKVILLKDLGHFHR